MGVAEEARSLGAAVEEIRGLGQLPAHEPDAAELLHEDEEEIALPGRARDGERAAGVRVGLQVSVP